MKEIEMYIKKETRLSLSLSHKHTDAHSTAALAEVEGGEVTTTTNPVLLEMHRETNELRC